MTVQHAKVSHCRYRYSQNCQLLDTYPEQQREKKKAFVEALRENGIVRHAATVAHVHRRIVYSCRIDDAEFRAAWDAALEDATDQVECSLYRQAISEKNVVATIFYLKHNRAKYREEIRIVVQGKSRQ